MTAARAKARRILATGLALAVVITIFLDLAVLTVPLYDMQLYDRVLESRNMDTLTMLSIACVAGLLLYCLLDYFRSACLVVLADAIGRVLDRTVLAEGLRRAAQGDRRIGAELIRDLNELQTFLASGGLTTPLEALCAPLFLAVSFMLHPVYGFVGIAGIALLVMVGVATDRLVRPALLAADARRMEAGHELSRRLAEPELAEGLGMLPAIGRHWAARHGEALAMLFAAATRALIAADLARLARLAVQAASMALGATLVIAGAATPGSLMGSNVLLNKLLAPFDHVVASWRHWALAHRAWQRIDAVLATARPGLPPLLPPAAHDPGLEVRDVALIGRDGSVLLHGITFAAPPGTLVLVAGPNGAGKTTLLRLLAGLAQPTTGSVLLAGAPPTDSRKTGFLPQSVALMQGTIAQNIACFTDPSLAGTFDPVVAAARHAEVHDLVGRLPKGYDTRLLAGGIGLSGGMRQRIGLARALHDAPPLLVLDEPDANLDGEGCAALLRALRAACERGAIAVVTSHRAAIRDAADLVLTLESGTILTAQGTATRRLDPTRAERATA